MIWSRSNSGKPRRLILHVGAHKTGSSAVQVFLRRRMPDLLGMGWDFCVVKGRPANWGHMFAATEADGELEFRLKPDVRRVFLERLSSGREDMILSSEDLFFLEARELVSVADDLKKHFQEVTLVAYVRRQDEMALSHWAQGAKTLQSARLFGGMNRLLPELSGPTRRYLSYADRLRQWGNAFPGAKRIFRVYDRDTLVNGSTVHDFLDAAGIRLTGLPSPDRRSNESFGASLVRFVYFLREQGVEQPQIRKILKAKILEDRQDRLLPSRQEAKSFVAEFDEDNRDLARMLGIERAFSDDFSRYPETAPMPELDRDFIFSNLMHIARNV